MFCADGMYMMEVDRVLRPGGYWVLSGPPINWKVNFKNWKRPREELENEQNRIEEMAKRLCWEKKYEKGEIAIWQKRINDFTCSDRADKVTMCQKNEESVWYTSLFSLLIVGNQPNHAPYLALRPLITF